MQRECSIEDVFLQHPFYTNLCAFPLAIGGGGQHLVYNTMSVLYHEEIVLVLMTQESDDNKQPATLNRLAPQKKQANISNTDGTAISMGWQRKRLTFKSTKRDQYSRVQQRSIFKSTKKINIQEYKRSTFKSMKEINIQEYKRSTFKSMKEINIHEYKRSTFKSTKEINIQEYLCWWFLLFC